MTILAHSIERRKRVEIDLLDKGSFKHSLLVKKLADIKEMMLRKKHLQVSYMTSALKHLSEE